MEYEIVLAPQAIKSLLARARVNLRDVLEPYLIQQGYLMRTPRGRVVTDKAYLHFGLTGPEARGGQPSLDLD